MKYLSLFSGIGGFEVAIHKVFPEAECLGYSEIKPSAIKVYKEHFPEHNNLGDISAVTKTTIQNLVKNGCDLIVGGFPCTNLSAISRLSPGVNNDGLKGTCSSLFFELLRVLNIVRQECPNVKFVIENNATMRILERETISKFIKDDVCSKDRVYLTKLDNADFGVQIRKRLFWTNFKVNKPSKSDCVQTWDDILDSFGNNEHLTLSDHVLDGYMNRTISGSNYGGKILNTVVTKNKTRKFVLLPKEQKNKSSRIQSSFVSDTCAISDRPYPIGKSRPILGSSLPSNVVLDRRNCKDGEFIVRYYSANELHRLMGFEPGWVKDGMTSVIDLLGNAVCVPVIVHIMKQLKLNET